MVYVNFVSENCWQVIFESSRASVVLSQETTEDKANDKAAAVIVANNIVDGNSIEESILAWQRELAYLIDIETDYWHNVA